MSSRIYVVCVAVIGLLLTACASTGGTAGGYSPDRYGEVQHKLRTDAAFRKSTIDQCHRTFGTLPKAEQEAYELMFRIKRGKYTETICARLISGLKSGRLSLKAINDFMAERDYRQVVLVIMGR